MSFEVVSDHRPVTSDKDSTLIQVITDVAPHYVSKEDVFVAAFIGTTDASSLLGDNPNNVDLAIVGQELRLWPIKWMNILKRTCILNISISTKTLQ